MADDVISLITRDHREMDQMFDRLQGNQTIRKLLIKETAAMYVAHSEAEQERVYPVLADELGDKERAYHSIEEHHEAGQMLERIQQMDPQSQEFERELRPFVEAVRNHNRQEEQEVLPKLQESLSKDKLSELAQAFMERREKTLGRMSPSRDELYELARELGVKHRADMGKDELAQAIRQVAEGQSQDGGSGDGGSGDGGSRGGGSGDGGSGDGGSRGGGSGDGGSRDGG
jgi:hemerythrin superfamily protein